MITFIIPVKNGLAYTRALVETVRTRNPGAAVEWIIVDSGSTDGTPEYCSAIGARVVPFSSEPFNYCAAVNAGAEHAGGDLWIIANNDIEFRSQGDLERLESAFSQWPLLAVVSPGRRTGEAELEFIQAGINGACWAVRPAALRSWGGMPESMTGYGYDEAYTTFQCWRRGYGLGWLTGWDVHHHGSVTFGPLHGTSTPALRRNLSRLLRALDAPDLDHARASPARIMAQLTRRERESAPLRLALSTFSERELSRQGYVNARRVGPDVRLTDAPAVLGQGLTQNRRQWLPWLANQLLLQPEAEAIGAEGWYVVRGGRNTIAATVEVLSRCVPAVGPPPPPLMPPLHPKRATLRERLYALLHEWRNRDRILPEGW